MIETDYEAYNSTFADTNQASFVEIFAILNTATFTANVSNNLQVKILLELVLLIALWHLSEPERNPTKLKRASCTQTSR